MVTTKTAALNLRIDPDIKAALREVAELEHRSIANMIEVLILDYCKARGVSVAGRGSVKDNANQEPRKEGQSQ